MIITMHCGGLPFNGGTIKTQSLGGSESAAYYLARELANTGHKVTLFTNHPNGGLWDGVRYVYAGQITDAAPLGTDFHYYSGNTPVDALIIQRAPKGFHFPHAARLRFLWLHDLALERGKPDLIRAMPEITGVLVVSEWHKKQVCEVYGLPAGSVFVVPNGIDMALYEDAEELPEPLARICEEKNVLLYSHRPERGLENLVKPDGIMHRLHGQGREDIHLFVCGYENTTQQMRPYYEQLWAACDALPNVTNLGALTKPQLAALQCAAGLHVYPTTFEETSCITAMECMAAALPMLTTDVAALPETCADSGTKKVPLKDGEPDIAAFVREITTFFDRPEEYRLGFRLAQYNAARSHLWADSAGTLQLIIENAQGNKSDAAVLRQFIRNSDIYAAKCFIETTGDLDENRKNPIYQQSVREVDELYSFAWKNNFAEHYRDFYEYEKARGITYGPERMEGNARFAAVLAKLDGLPDNSLVLDYGCAHGHYTVNLAKLFPQHTFFGVDLAASNIATAKAWAADEGLTNIKFFVGDAVDHETITVETDSYAFPQKFNAIIAAEVIEHVAAPFALIEKLHNRLAIDGRLIMTTPYGPWEAQGYRQHHPWRAHLWHFDRADLHEMFSDFEFSISLVPAGADGDDVVGSYVYAVKRTEGANIHHISMDRKFDECVPRETLSVCMIVRNGEESLLRTLQSVSKIADEIVLCLDPSTTDATAEVIQSFRHKVELCTPSGAIGAPAIREFTLPSPVLEMGFDAARNESLAHAHGDWILWIDADEYLDHPERLLHYLRQNPVDGYAIAQHHFSMEPVGLLKTDYPVRMFRNGRGIQFFGVVHEHPEKAMNSGIGVAFMVPEVAIGHGGYTTENVRRERFMRNIDLMRRDREKYPDRRLGRFLWVRDISHLIRYEQEQGQPPSEELQAMAREGIALWDGLLDENQVRMLVDGLQFYSVLTAYLGGRFKLSLKMDTAPIYGNADASGVQPLNAVFLNEEDAQKFFNVVLHEKVKGYESKYL